MSTIIGVFHNTQEAGAAIQAIKDMHPDTQGAYVKTENHDVLEKNGAEEVGKNTAGGAASGAVTGGVIGTIAGLAVANGILPGLGSLFVAGPIATALGLTGGAATTAAGAMTGAAAGGLIGTLTGMGVGASEAKKYEDYVKEGDTLVIVDGDADPHIETMMHDHRAKEVARY